MMKRMAGENPLENPIGDVVNRSRMSPWRWLQYGPWLAQLVIVRRCNLRCGYCNEFDQTSAPVPFADLAARLRKLRALRTWAVCLTGGEPTLHPQLPRILAQMRELGFRRRQMITNGYRLTRASIEVFNRAGLTDLQISIDGVHANDTTQKTLVPLRPKLELLARYAKFQVVMSSVVGCAPPAEVEAVIDFAQAHGFTPRILLVHDAKGRLKLSAAELTAFRHVKQRIGRRASEAGDYREQLIATGAAPFKCRAGARYLYVDEFGRVNRCAQTRGIWSKDLLSYTLNDLKTQFHTVKHCHATCTIGCARTASATDRWRVQRMAPAAHGRPPA